MRGTPDDGELVFLPTGWFRGTDEALASSWVLVDGRARLLVDCAKMLYDPRRVAAGAAGVPVRHPTLR